MLLKEEPFVRSKNIGNLDAYHDVILARAESTQFDNDLLEFEKMLEENDKVEMDYKNLLLCLLTKKENVEPHEKRTEISDEVIVQDDYCNAQEENDPQYELFLKSLKEHGKSYILEYEKDGSSVVIKYEGDTSSDMECDPEPRRKLRSAMKKKNGLPHQMPVIENQHKNAKKSTSFKRAKNSTRRKSNNKLKNEKAETVEYPNNEIVPDLDYLTFLQNSTLVDGYFVCTYKGHTVVYEKHNGDNNLEKEKQDDGFSSDVEILDGTSFYEKGNLNPPVIASTNASKYMNKDSSNNLGGPILQSEFRKQVTAVLRKPYNKEEYDKLWKDIKVRKPEVRHRDLRGGREIEYFTEKDGKSYLDGHPDLKKILVQFQDNKPKCLNLLRGFFFWLQKLAQKGSFEPWGDAECLAISPESCQAGISLKMETFN